MQARPEVRSGLQHTHTYIGYNDTQPPSPTASGRLRDAATGRRSSFFRERAASDRNNSDNAWTLLYAHALGELNTVLSVSTLTWNDTPQM